jgi:aminopeptidase
VPLGPPPGLAAKHLRDILTQAFAHGDGARALVVFDTQSELAELLSAGYRHCLPGASFIDFDTVTPAFILARFAELRPDDLVVLVQSTSFRLDAYRIRIELFKHGIKVLEHPHLGRMRGEQAIRYVDSLAYDARYYRGVGHALKERIDGASRCEIKSEGASLLFSGGFESAKLNVGDYRGMPNVGGQFPIGEVFTESRDLQAVNGQARIFAFADVNFEVSKPEEPITLVVEAGRVVGTERSTPDFDEVLARIVTDEGAVWLRELGFGMNRAFTQERLVKDVGTYERMCGIHFSLGGKHNVYKKPGFSRREHRHHVDVFAATTAVTLDDELIFAEGRYTLAS